MLCEQAFFPVFSMEEAKLICVSKVGKLGFTFWFDLKAMVPLGLGLVHEGFCHFVHIKMYPKG